MFLTRMPIYLVNGCGFSLQEMGLYLMLPYLAMLIIANIAGWIANGLLQRGVSPTLVRKGFQGVVLLVQRCVCSYCQPLPRSGWRCCISRWDWGPWQCQRLAFWSIIWLSGRAVPVC